MRKRTPTLPRSPRLIRTWEVDGWSYRLEQTPAGSYLASAIEIDGDGWRVESADTIKACLAAVNQSDAEMEKLLDVPEASSPC